MDGDDDECSSDTTTEVVIVGGGIAGLVCARELLRRVLGEPGCYEPKEPTTRSKTIRVRLIEATGEVGGRIRRGPGGRDLGAELVHGSGHELWDTILEYQEKSLLPAEGCVGGVRFDRGLEPFFLTAHADGGPDEEPTIHGKYGAYYVGGELVRYDDPRALRLKSVLEGVLDHEDENNNYTDQTSLAEALASHPEGASLPDDLHQLCVAGYGNTAGNSDLGDLSVSVLLAFEQHWEENEIAGDYRTTFGMHSVASATLGILRQEAYRESFSLHLNTPVVSIESPSGGGGDSKTRVVCEDGVSFSADAVVVAVPPTRLPELFERSGGLPEHKCKALEKIGFARVTKIFCIFDRALWPEAIQSVVAADQPIPELWFRPKDTGNDGGWEVVSYLASSAAANLANSIRERQQKTSLTREALATRIVVEQLSTIFGVSLEEVEQACISKETLVCDWKEDHPYVGGGYVFPRPGMTMMDLEALAEPMGAVRFAGEATNTLACCTVQAAMQTGIRAAHEILSEEYAE